MDLQLVAMTGATAVVFDSRTASTTPPTRWRPRSRRAVAVVAPAAMSLAIAGLDRGAVSEERASLARDAGLEVEARAVKIDVPIEEAILTHADELDAAAIVLGAR